MDSSLDETLPTSDSKQFQLNWEDRDGSMVVTPSDQDRFVVKVGKAIEILRHHDKEKGPFEDQFKLLLNQLAKWLSTHDTWERAFLTAGEGVLRFIVVRKTSAYDEMTTDALSDLDLSLANDPDLNLMTVNVTALPLVSDESLQSFLDSSFALEYNGKRIRSHRAGES